MDETLIKVRNEMNAHKNAYPGLSNLPFLGGMFQMLPYSIVKNIVHQGIEKSMEVGIFPPSFTNAGIVDSERLSFGDVKVDNAYVMGDVNYPPAFQLGLSSFNKSLTFSVCHCGDAADKRLVERFFDALAKELPR